jgi:hypothetical protein
MEQKLVLPDFVPDIVREEFAGIGAPIALPQSEDCAYFCLYSFIHMARG